MTSTSIRASSTHAFDKSADLLDLGAEIGSLMRRIVYLGASLFTAAEAVETPNERSRTGVDRMLVFSEMMEESATKALALAEQVERHGTGHAIRDIDAASQAPDVVTRYWQAEAAYNAGALAEREYHAAGDALDRWEPKTPLDFVRKFEAVYNDGGCPNAERTAMIMGQAKRLLSGCRGTREG